MAPSFDCASSLLCTEDTSVFDDGEYQGTVEVYEDSWRPSFDHRRGQDDFGGVADELPLQSEECFRLMLEKEWQQWVGEDYLNRFHFGDLDFGARNEAIDWILKVGFV